MHEYHLSDAELDAYLAHLQRVTRDNGYHGLTLDRCRHGTVHTLTAWVFNADHKQVGVISLTSPGDDTYKANRMFHGLPTSERHFTSATQAVLHIAEGMK